MNKRLLIALMVCVFTRSSAQTIYPSGVTNCIARYDFSSPQSTVIALNDVSGNNNNASGVYNLAAANSWRGLPNKAMKFNGTSSYALVPNSASLTPSSVTMVALINNDNFYSGLCQFSQIIVKGYPGYVQGQYGISITDDIYDNNCSLYDSVRQQLIGYFYNSLNLPSVKPSAGNYLSKSKWYFVAVSYDGNQVKYYQTLMDTTFHNNNLLPYYSAAGIGSTFGTSTQNLTIGNTLNPPYPYWFNGRMDEIALFNRILTNAEVQSVYDYLWGVFEVNSAFTRTTLCQGTPFQLPFKVNANNAFLAGNSITAQLSDITGNFTSPITLGTTMATTSGSISCVVPIGTPVGTGYKIRLLSSTPYQFSEIFQTTFTVSAPATTPVVSIVANPSINISSGQLVTFMATVTNGGTSPTVQWKKNGVAITGATLSSYSTNSIANGDIISAVARSSEPCATPDSAISNTLQMNVSSSVSGISGIQSMSLYPNQTTGLLHISATVTGAQLVPYTVRNVIGQIVDQGVFTPVSGIINSTIILPASVSSGTYLLSLGKGNMHAAKNFTIVRD